MGGGPAHTLALDHGLRPLFASLGATVVPSGVYGTGEQFVDGRPTAGLAQATDRAVREALVLAAAYMEGGSSGPTGGISPSTDLIPDR
jgi:FMN reductase